MWKKTREKEALPMSESHSFLSGEILRLLKKEQATLERGNENIFKKKVWKLKV